jgi:hypothetical protein
MVLWLTTAAGALTLINENWKIREKFPVGTLFSPCLDVGENWPFAKPAIGPYQSTNTGFHLTKSDG